MPCVVGLFGDGFVVPLLEGRRPREEASGSACDSDGAVDFHLDVAAVRARDANAVFGGPLVLVAFGSEKVACHRGKLNGVLSVMH